MYGSQQQYRIAEWVLVSNQAEGLNLYARNAIDINGNDSLAKIASRIGRNSSVLDLGCAVGALGRWLAQEKRCVVDGVEGNPRSAAIAREFYRDVWEIDIESDQLAEVLGQRTYTYIVCADVLEHLRDPGSVLRLLVEHLERDGRIFVSIPNVGYIGLILEIMAGDFRYRPEGILDSTHLRFFTRTSFLRFLRTNGFAGKVIDYTIVDVQRSEFSAYNTQYLHEAILQDLQKRSDGLVYQYVAEVVPEEQAGLLDSTVAVPAPPLGPRSLPALYWRGLSAQYEKENSKNASVLVGACKQNVEFEFPVGAAHALRLNPSDQPGVVVLHKIELRCDEGVLWSWDRTGGTLLSGPYGGLEEISSGGGLLGVALAVKDHAPWLTLPIPAELARAANRLAVKLSLPPLEAGAPSLNLERRSGQDLQKSLLDAEQKVGSLISEVRMLRTSRSWRITRPLRAVTALIGRIRRDRR